MPIYYFDLYDNDRVMRDEFGCELDDLYEAREQALAILPDLARDRISAADAHDYAAVVRCREGRVRYEARLSLRGAWVEAPAYPPLGAADATIPSPDELPVPSPVGRTPG